MDDTEQLRQLIEAGIACHISGDLHAALQCYSSALDLEPDNVLVLYNVGCLFEEAGYMGEAAELFATAAKVSAMHEAADPDVLRAAKEFGKRGLPS